MKVSFLSLIFLCSICFNVTTLFAKKDTTIVFCNQSLHKVKKSYAPYYAKVFKQKDGTTGVIQFTRYGLLCMKGAFTDDNLTEKQGAFEYYSLKGPLSKRGEYKNDKMDGVWQYFAKNGTVTAEGRYVNGNRTGEWNYFDKHGSKVKRSNYVDGKLDGEELEWFHDAVIFIGHYENDEKVGVWQRWYNNGKVDYLGKYINGKREGEWKFYFESGNLAALEVYENGEAIDAKWFDEDGKPVKAIKPYELSPEFPGGSLEMARHIQNTFEYPELAREMGEQGTVWIEFRIYPDGILKDIKIVVSVSPSIDAEAIRIIKLMPNWIPGLDHNRNRPITYTIPIKCRLG